MPKCPICKKNYRKGNYIKHIWAHKRKTVAYLAKKRKAKGSKSSKKVKKKGKYCSECGKRLG